MKRIGIVPVSRGAGAGLVTAMLATELAATSASGAGIVASGGFSAGGAGSACAEEQGGRGHEKGLDFGGNYVGITVLELGRGNLYDQLCADRWFRMRQMVSYWNCIHGEGRVERIVNPKCGVNWLIRTPDDNLWETYPALKDRSWEAYPTLKDRSWETFRTSDDQREEGPVIDNQTLERGRAVKLLYSLPGDVAFVDFSSVKGSDMLYLLEDMDQLVAVVDPMPSKILEGYELLYRLKLWKKPVVWAVNRWTDQVDVKEIRRTLGVDRKWVALPEIPRGLLYQEEYGGIGLIEHQQIRRLMAPGMEELMKRLRL